MLEHDLRVWNVDLDELKATLRNAGHNELEGIVGTMAETFLEQGEERGLVKDLAEGKAEAFLRQAPIIVGTPAGVLEPRRRH